MKVYVVKSSWRSRNCGDDNEVNHVFTDKDKAEQVALDIVQGEINEMKALHPNREYDLDVYGHFVNWDNDDWFECQVYEMNLDE